MSARFDGGHPADVKVWDPLVRVFHWSLASCFLLNSLLVDGGKLHRWLGYTAAALVAFRVVWGFVGSQHARFRDFVPGPRGLAGYLQQLLRGNAPRHLGHNPAAAVMILTLLTGIVALGVTGWLMGTDRYFGDEALEAIHMTIADVMLALVAVHVLAAVVESVRHRENLIKAMITGYKRPPTGHD